MTRPTVKRSESTTLGKRRAYRMLEAVEGQFDDAPTDELEPFLARAAGRYNPSPPPPLFPRITPNCSPCAHRQTSTNMSPHAYREASLGYPSPALVDEDGSGRRHFSRNFDGLVITAPPPPLSPPLSAPPQIVPSDNTAAKNPVASEASNLEVLSKALAEYSKKHINESDANRFGPLDDSDINDTDVLFGRGGGTNKHVGNRYFRALVSHYRPKYVLSKKAEKNQIARAIVSAVRAVGGRFLKKNEKTCKWEEVGDKKAADKASQAIREGLASRMRCVLVANGSLNSPREAVLGTKGVVGQVHEISPQRGPGGKRRRVAE